MSGITALHCAAVTGQHEVAELLLKAGASTELTNHYPRSPSSSSPTQAAAAGSSSSCSEGASSSSSNSGQASSSSSTAGGGDHVGSTSSSESSGNTSISSNLPAAFALSPEIGARTALHLAATHGHANVVQVLIDAKANVNAMRTDGCTPLHLAACFGYDEVAKLLLAAGAKLDILDMTQNTALQLAAWDGHAAVVQQLIAKGADLELPDAFGRTPLILAADDGHVEVVRLLVSAGAKLETKTHKGHTALFLAADHNEKEVVKVLLGAGADPNTTRPSGITVLECVAGLGWAGVARQLIAAGADLAFGLALTLAARKGHLEVVQLLLGQHPDSPAPQPSGTHERYYLVRAANLAVERAVGDRDSAEWKNSMGVWAAVVRALAKRRGPDESAEVCFAGVMMPMQESGPFSGILQLTAAWEEGWTAVVEGKAALQKVVEQLQRLRREVQHLIVGAAGLLRGPSHSG